MKPDPNVILSEHLEPIVGTKVVGLLAGAIVGGETHSIARGDIAPDAIVEIGSIGKTLTATLLSVMVQSGDVTLDDPVNRFLPARAHLPARDGNQITLLELATHTSGLPSLPPDFIERVVDERNPYAHYTVEHLYEDLPRTQLTLSPDGLALYSNLGFGLLGHVLGLAAAAPYEELVVERVCRPLAMTETTVGAPADGSRRAQGHDADGTPTTHWGDATMPGRALTRLPSQTCSRTCERTSTPTRQGSELPSAQPMRRAPVPANARASDWDGTSKSRLQEAGSSGTTVGQAASEA